MPPAAAATTEIEKKKAPPGTSRFKKGMERAEAVAKRAKDQVKELREGGRYGRAVVDTVEAAVGGGLGGLLDGAGLNIPTGPERKYSWIQVEQAESGEITFLDKDGDKVLSLKDADRGIQSEQMSIPAALPLGLTAVGIGAAWEQPDLLEGGKGMVAYGTGRLACDAARAVRELFNS